MAALRPSAEVAAISLPLPSSAATSSDWSASPKLITYVLAVTAVVKPEPGIRLWLARKLAVRGRLAVAPAPLPPQAEAPVTWLGQPTTLPRISQGRLSSKLGLPPATRTMAPLAQE